MTKKKNRETSKKIPGEPYKKARLIYWNTDINKTVQLNNDKTGVSIRNALYVVVQRNGYKKRFMARKSKNKTNSFILVKRII